MTSRFGRLITVGFLTLAALPAPVKAELKPYGFLLINYIQHWHRPNMADIPTQAVSESAAAATENSGLFHVRQSRVGLNVDGVTALRDAKWTGTLEMDFWGLRGAGAAGNDVLQVTPRMRLAFIRAQWGDHALLFGQDWNKAFAPLSPASLMRQAVPALQNAGNLWNRAPQLRWDAAWKEVLPGAALNTKLALVRAFSADNASRTSGAATVATQADQPGSGESAGTPALQAQVEAQVPVAGRTATAGVSMQYLRQRFHALVPQPAGADGRSVDGVLGALHAQVPVHPLLELSGEAFYGSSNQNLQGLGQVYNDNGFVRTSLARGGWIQAAVKPCESAKVHLIYGIERIAQDGLAAGTLYSNESTILNVVHDASKEIALSAEFGRIHSLYKGALRGVAHSLGLAAQYKF